MNWLDSLLNSSRICEYLLSPQWSEDFPPQFLDRGRRLASQGKVLGVDHFIGSDMGFVATARVQGSRIQPYKVSLTGRCEKGDWIFWGSCACPVSEDCKHVAAVVYDLQRSIRDAEEETGGEHDHQFWLNSLTSALGPKKLPEKVKKPARRTGGLAFLVTLRDDGF